MLGHSDGPLTPSVAVAHDAMPQFLLLSRAGTTLGWAVDMQELSGCKESHRMASRNEKPGLWVYLPISLHLEGLLGGVLRRVLHSSVKLESRPGSNAVCEEQNEGKKGSREKQFRGLCLFRGSPVPQVVLVVH